MGILGKAGPQDRGGSVESGRNAGRVERRQGGEEIKTQKHTGARCTEAQGRPPSAECFQSCGSEAPAGQCCSPAFCFQGEEPEGKEMILKIILALLLVVVFFWIGWGAHSCWGPEQFGVRGGTRARARGPRDVR